MTYEWLATAGFGLEGIVAQELKSLNLENIRAMPGGAFFNGTALDAMRANLWLRTADRVLLVIGRFEAESFDDLFEGIRALPWERYIPKTGAFPVNAKCVRSQLMSVSDCQAITKKAIVERLKKTYRTDWFAETGSRYGIDVAIQKNSVLVTLNSSGTPLNKRGYRTFVGEAPLRETLAAALIMLSPWTFDRPFADPMCGTGTLVIEAAMITTKRAPGLLREFDIASWQTFGDTGNQMDSLRADALAEFEQGKKDALEYYSPAMGFDLDSNAIVLAKRHGEQAGLLSHIRLEQRDAGELRLEPRGGCFVTNPPYGERLEGAEDSCGALRRLFDAHTDWTLSAVSAHAGFERLFGRKANNVRRLYNGRLECGFMTFYHPRAKVKNNKHKR